MGSATKLFSSPAGGIWKVNLQANDNFSFAHGLNPGTPILLGARSMDVTSIDPANVALRSLTTDPATALLVIPVVGKSLADVAGDAIAAIHPVIALP